MDKEKLIDILQKASARGIKKPVVPELLKGTYMGRYRELNVEVDEEIKRELVDTIGGFSELDIFNEKMFNMGFGASRVNYDMLARSLLYRTCEIGAEEAVVALDKFIGLGATPVDEIVVLTGIKVDKEQELGNGVILIPFSSVPSSFLKDSLEEAAQRAKEFFYKGFVPMHTRPKAMQPSAALKKKNLISPKTYEPGEKQLPSYVSLIEELYEVCDCLTLIGPSTPLPLAHTGVLEEWVPCSVVVPSGFSSPAHEILSMSDPYPFKEEDYMLANQIVQGYFRLEEKDREHLRIALQRLNQALRRQKPVDKAIDLGIALESLLLSEIKSGEQLSFTFRLRGAWMLGKDVDSREKYLNLFGKLYWLRSQAVHTGKVPKRVKIKNESNKEVTEVISRGIDCCVKIIKGIINKGSFPEWNKLILGSVGEGNKK